MISVDNLLTADTIFDVGVVYLFDGTGRTVGSLATRDGRIVAVGDDLNSLAGPETTVIERPSAVVMPSFFDSHNHMLHTAVDIEAPDLSRCRSIREVLATIAEAARAQPAGTWIVPAKGWHETNLEEGRLPTAAELDRASMDHPVALRRGGHVMVANSKALDMAGIDSDTPDPPGGTIERDGAGRPTGALIERPAFAAIYSMLPSPDRSTWVERLATVCRRYNQVGITSVRDPGLYPNELLVYQEARDRGLLTVRTEAMIRLDPASGFAAMKEELYRWDARSGLGDDLLRLNGIKIFLDGGVEGAAMNDPYANQPDYSGHLFLEPGQVVELGDIALTRGWRIGCHAVGDRAVDIALDAFAELRARQEHIPNGWLTIEHGFLADAQQRRRAIEMGVSVTVQHPLLWFLGGNMIRYWGGHRTDASFPVREWVDEGAIVAAGSDSNIAPFNPMLAVWGLCTRGTASAGVRGPEHAVDRTSAFALSTVAGSRLSGLKRRGPLLPGYDADLMLFDATDPLDCDVDDLPDLEPDLVMMNGRLVRDPENPLPN